MEQAIDKHFHQSPHMGLELLGEFGRRIKAACTRDGYDFRLYFLQKSIDARMHAQVNIEHAI